MSGLITVYEFDKKGFFTGQCKDVDVLNGIPFRFTTVKPPEALSAGCCYRLDGKQWVLENTPVESSTCPQQVTMRQARLALLGAGLLEAVEAAIADAGAAARIEWEYAQEVQRAAGLVPAMAAALGMTDAQLDALFVQAAAL